MYRILEFDSKSISVWSSQIAENRIKDGISFSNFQFLGF